MRELNTYIEREEPSMERVIPSSSYQNTIKEL